MDFTELLVKGSLLLCVLLVHPDYQFVGRFDVVEVGVVPPAEYKLAPRRWMSAHSPTAWLVTVVFLYEVIGGGGDGPEDPELSEIRAEP
jgi:hypothetical protein